MRRSWTVNERYKSHNVNAKVLQIRHRSTFKHERKKIYSITIEIVSIFWGVTQKPNAMKNFYYFPYFAIEMW